MNYQNTTQIPNILFDRYLCQLKASEALLIFIILRQTNGWYNPKTKKRKTRDWISYAQFKKKTGLSKKTISKGISNLIKLNIIQASTRNGKILWNSNDRQGKIGIYYTCLLGSGVINSKTSVKKGREHRKKLHITKLTPTKLNKQKEKRSTRKKNIQRLTDSERIQQILSSKKFP